MSQRARRATLGANSVPPLVPWGLRKAKAHMCVCVFVLLLCFLKVWDRLLQPGIPSLLSWLYFPLAVLSNYYLTPGLVASFCPTSPTV